MKKIVINRCYGGYYLSHEAVMRYAELIGLKLYHEESFGVGYMYYLVPVEEYRKKEKEKIQNGDFGKNYNLHFSPYSIPRDDERLIQVIEELKEKANAKYSDLKIVEIPDDVEWMIEEYDGKEWVAEKHRVWF